MQHRDKNGVLSATLQFFQTIKAKKKTQLRKIAIISLAILAMNIFKVDASFIGSTTVESVNSNGSIGNDDSVFPVISETGRYIAFESLANNLVPYDTNGKRDVFFRDRHEGITKRISVHSNGTEANDDSGLPSISIDGRYVTFVSKANNLVDNDTNNKEDVFIHDTVNGTTIRILGVYDRQPDGDSSYPKISGNGNYVVFTSRANNLVVYDDNEGVDTFVYERTSGHITLVSIDSSGNPANGDSFGHAASSYDGQYISFTSWASNLISGDINNHPDVFLKDMATGDISLVSIGPNGNRGNDLSASPALSSDGKFVAFLSRSTNFQYENISEYKDIYLRDIDAGTTIRLSESPSGIQSNGWSDFPRISADGRYVTFFSAASNLIDNDTNGYDDIFLYDSELGALSCVSVNSVGGQGNMESHVATISANGQYVAFHSHSTNFDGIDTNEKWDVYVHKNFEDMYKLFLPVIYK